MVDVVRHHRRDALLNEEWVRQYLSEVAAVRFDESFRHAAAIEAHISPHARMGNLQIKVNGGEPLRRPHRNLFPVTDVVSDEVGELELLTFDGRDGGVAAVGWLVHHSCLGALTERSGVKGVRLRAGNIQVGGHDLLEEAFPEPRFNAWSIGEIHVVDPRLVPNAQGDHFEQNVHFADLTAQVPAAELQFLLGLEVGQICLDPWSVQIRFAEGGRITIQGPFEHVDLQGRSHMHQAGEEQDLGPVFLRELIQQQITGLRSEATHLDLDFSNGARLRIWSEAIPYENGQIHPPRREEAPVVF